jgi:uncharacterized protein YbaR (Trm112 family)
VDIPDDCDEDEEFLKKMHHVLLEVSALARIGFVGNHPPNTVWYGMVWGGLHPAQVEVVEGTLTCTETGRVYPISKGVPNMLPADE